jgi:ABC-2 type transport system permease protein
MALGLWRDRAGLILAFALPPLVFMVFASVFSSGASGRLDVNAGVYDASPSLDSRRLVQDLQIRLARPLRIYPSASALQKAVLDGDLDGGVIVKAGAATDPTPSQVIVNPARRAIGEVLTAKVEASGRAVLAGPLMRRNMLRLESLLRLTPAQAGRLRRLPQPGASPSFAAETVLGAEDPLVVYYAGAVSILFLLFTAAQGAASVIDDRAAGLRLRLGLSAAGMAPMMAGRMLWLTCLGVGQSLVLFSVADLVYHISFLTAFAPWLVTALFAAAASAGLALAVTALCKSRQQAQTASTFAILILAAVGGSMAPRFLMPAAMQSLGWFTPHAWVIEAYQTLLWRRQFTVEVVKAWGVLALFAAGGFGVALLAEQRRRL